MDVSQMDDLVARLPELERQAAELERQATALRQIIDGVRALTPGRSIGRLAPASSTRGFAGSQPRGREAIRIIAADFPGRVWRVQDVKAEILKRGWPDPGTGAEAALKRLVTSGEAERVGHGAYRIGRQEIEPAALPATEEAEALC